MNVRIKQPLLPVILCITLLFCFIGAPASVYSEQDASPVMPDSEEARKLLEDSLSIVEIDHEIERITKRIAELRSSRANCKLKFRIWACESKTGEIGGRRPSVILHG